MIKTIENEFLKIEINEKGAELSSIKSKKTGIEYLWQGNPEFWRNKATVLFPICGRLFGGKYTYKGKEYEMPLHGIAKLFDFISSEISSTEIEFTLNSSEETKAYYPFDFSFTVKYVLEDNLLKQEFIVKNTGDKNLLFSVGGHPGFNVPFTSKEKFEDYYLEFSTPSLEKLIFSETCFCTGKKETYNFIGNKLPLEHSLFDNDAMFFETESGVVKLKSKTSNNSLEVSYSDMTTLGLWHKPKTEAPFVCIEPWHGVPSTDGVVDDFENKQYFITLSPNKNYQNYLAIKVVEN